MAKAVGNDSIIFTAPLNSSRCMDDNEDGQLSTTLYIIQMIIYSITILVAIANITLHFVVKDLRTISGILAMILCISVIGSTSMATGSLSIIFANNISVACALLINFLYAMAFVYQAWQYLSIPLYILPFTPISVAKAKKKQIIDDPMMNIIYFKTLFLMFFS